MLMIKPDTGVNVQKISPQRFAGSLLHTAVQLKKPAAGKLSQMCNFIRQVT